LELRRVLFACLALLAAPAVSAQEMQSPHLTNAAVNWDAAAGGQAEPGATAAEIFGKLNAASQPRFAGIAKSSVPVLLPFDIDAARKEADATADRDKFIRANFHATDFFQAGPAGYEAAFSLRTADVTELSDIGYADPVYVLMSGFAFTYDLDGPALPPGEPVKELEADFPGIRRTLHESYVRYSFERYGTPYVAQIYCRDTRPRPKLLTCKQADRVAVRFLRALTLAGGSPAVAQSVVPVATDRPAAVSPDFSYFSPGFLIPGSGLKKDLSGRPDYTVYAHLRFPLKDAPDFANSQSFNNWGDCDFTGRAWVGRRGGKRAAYSCKVNGQPLVFDESTNYAYPWRDNFCEHRNFYVGQCPGGEGHQGQDIRPSSCTLFNDGADRCQPYQHDVVAVHDGMILRARKQEAVFLFVNTANTHIRVRYMHMSPARLDADGIVSGKPVAEGDVIGKVGNFNGHERGTTYHLHFDMQVATKIGWVFVNPYATLVTAYERLIGARGTEIKDGDVAPPTAVVSPVIEHPDLAASAAPKAQTEAGEPVKVVPVRAKTHKARKAQKHVPRHRRHRKRGHSADD
jgi:murein DD-endopeptidase MepM/ murein hydrolase activator NlpD